MSENQILNAVMELKEDIGGVKTDIQNLRTEVTAHVEASAKAHARIAALEIRNAQIRGMTTVWSALAVGAGTVVGYVAQFLINFFKGH